MRRKLITLISAMVILVMVITGCGTTATTTVTQTTTAATTTMPTTTAQASSEKATISIFGMYTTTDGDANCKAYAVQKAKFLTDFPNIEFKEEQVPHDEYETKMKTYAAGNELPDSFELKGTMIASLVDNSQIVDIDPVLALVTGLKDGYKGGAFEDFTYKEKAYAAPFQFGNNHNIFWNEAIFAECGITAFPATWTDFISAIDKIKAKGYIPIAMGNKGKWVAESLIYNTLVYRYVPVEWYQSLKNGQGAKWTDPEIVQATKTMQDLAKNGTFNSDMNSIDNSQQRTLYYNKKAAMFIEGFWAVDGVISDAPEDVLKATNIAQFPAIEGAKGAGNVNQAGTGWGWAVRSGLDAAQSKAVANFIDYATGEDFANLVIENRGMPATKPSVVDEAKLPALYLKLLKLNDESVYAPIFDVQLAPQVVDALYSNMQELLIGSITPEKYCELAQAEMDAK